jgi:hypothetical protein
MLSAMQSMNPMMRHWRSSDNEIEKDCGIGCEYACPEVFEKWLFFVAAGAIWTRQPDEY